MKILVVYETEYGNTERIARAIGEALSAQGATHVVPVEEVSQPNGESTDLLVFGTLTQRHGLPASRKLLESPPSAFRNIWALAFDTRYRGPRWVRGSAAEEIGHLLRAAGCRLLAPPESFFVVGAGGPLEPGEEYRAQARASKALGRTPHPLSG